MDNQIRFKFLKKPVSNPLLLISKDSALSSEVLPWAVKAEILSEFSHKLECSGWDEKSRYAFIMAELTAPATAGESRGWDLPPVSPSGMGSCA